MGKVGYLENCQTRNSADGNTVRIKNSELRGSQNQAIIWISKVKENRRVKGGSKSKLPKR